MVRGLWHWARILIELNETEVIASCEGLAIRTSGDSVAVVTLWPDALYRPTGPERPGVPSFILESAGTLRVVLTSH